MEYVELLSKFNKELQLKYLHYSNLMCMVFKFIPTYHTFTLLLVAINDIFRKNKQAHQCNTRQKGDLHSIKVNTEAYSILITILLSAGPISHLVAYIMF